jgi:hypothetical protein
VSSTSSPRRPRASLSALAAALAALAAACNRGNPPALFPIDDQVAVVGQPLVVQLVASDPEGDSLSFGFAAPAVPDLAGTAAITRTPDGQGLFTFTPVATQVGLQVMDLWVSDGRHEDHVPLFIRVQQAAGVGTVPVFSHPLGAGTVLDLEQTDCLALDIEIDDADSSSVVLEQAPPLVEGAMLDAAPDGRTGTWSWCPDRRQIETSDRYTLRLVADDLDNPAVTKEFVIVLRRRRGDECPGEFPVVEHAPTDATTRLDPAITAVISDDVGLRDQPYLVWATEDPGDPIDFDLTSLVPMELQSGDLSAGTWVGYIPNPIANAPDGTAMPIYYLISATDDDDVEGDCDHRSDDPDDGGMHRITLTAGGDEAVGLCEPCSFDVQCGGDDDHCLPTAGGGRCGRACTSDDGCDEGYACSPEPLESVEGAVGRQCIPAAGGCDDPGGGCDDDDHEPDGTPAEAAGKPPLDGPLGGRMLCGGDEDWYALQLDEPAQLVASLEGDAPPDLDLSLVTEDGVLVQASEGLSSSEMVEAACLDPGAYLVRVYSIDAEPAGAYALDLQLSACGGGGGGGDCCMAHAAPGCDDAAVQACVCDLDMFCCESEWDMLCAGSAGSDCDACGGTMAMDDGCCAAHATPGCSDATVQACVCAADPYCCNTQWDATCVGEVESEGCGSC